MQEFPSELVRLIREAVSVGSSYLTSNPHLSRLPLPESYGKNHFPSQRASACCPLLKWERPIKSIILTPNTHLSNCFLPQDPMFLGGKDLEGGRVRSH